MDAQLIELEIPGLPLQKNHQKLPTNHQKLGTKKASASMIFRTLCGGVLNFEICRLPYIQIYGIDI